MAKEKMTLWEMGEVIHNLVGDADMDTADQILSITNDYHQQQLRELKEALGKKFEPTVPMSIKYEDWHGIWSKYIGGDK